MEIEMHPVMQVKRIIIGEKPLYELTLSRANFNHLCAGCPDFDRLVGHTDDGLLFYIFENPHGEMPKSFRPLPNREGYWANVGAPVPRIPQGITNEEFCILSQQACNNLEKAINESGRIPVEEETSLGKINLGYVTIKVKKAKD
jgi:hypothetical protein